MKIYILILCAILTFAPALHAADDTKPVVISLSAVGDLTSNYGHEAQNLLRPMIVTRLVEDYDCVVLDRSSCQTLTTEAILTRMKEVTDKNADAGKMLAADYAIRAHIRKAKQRGQVDVYLYMQDLRFNDDRAPKKHTWVVEADYYKRTKVFDPQEVAKSIVLKIAEALSLKDAANRFAADKAAVPQERQTWAVLPFVTLNAGSIYSQPVAYPFRQQYMTLAFADEYVRGRDYWVRYKGKTEPYRQMTEAERKTYIQEYVAAFEKNTNAFANAIQHVQALSKSTTGDTSLAAIAEITLQQQGRHALVERASLDRVLAELRLKSAVGVNENIGGYIARLAGADRVLLGMMAKTGNTHHIIMHLVDAKTSLVLAAAEARSVSGNMLADTIQRLTLDLSSQTHVAPSITECAKWQRKREASFYCEKLPYIYKPTGVAAKASWLNCIEINYLLMNDEPDYIAGEVVPWLRLLLYDIRYTRLDVYVRGVAILDAMLQAPEVARHIRSPKLVRANAYLSEWQYEKALSLANAHMKSHPNADRLWADYIRAAGMYGLGNYQEAISLAKKVVDRSELGSSERFNHLSEHRISPSNWEGDHYNKALNLLVQIAQDSHVNDEELELYAMRRGGIFQWHRRELRLMTLVEKYDGIEKTLDLFPRVFNDKGRNPNVAYGKSGDTDLRTADNLVRMGRTDEAMQMFKRFAANSHHGYYAQARLAQLEQDGEHGKEGSARTKEARLIDGGMKKYSSASEMSPVPKNYKIYCYPVAGCRANYVTRICEAVGNWMGTKVVLMDVLPCPVNTLVKAWESHDVYSFSRQLLQGLVVPEDAVYVFFVAPDIQFRGLTHVKNLVFPVGGNPLLVASVDAKGQHVGHEQAAGAVVEAVMKCVLDPLSLEWNGWMRCLGGSDAGFRRERNYCDVKYCMNLPRLSTNGNYPLMCQACWKRCTSADWDACHQALQAYMQRDIKMLASECHAPPDFLDELDWHNPEVVRATERLAEDGNPNSLYLMGLVYNSGLGIRGDREKAASCFKQAYDGLVKLAEAHDPEAANHLGRMHLNGYGIPVNHDEAFTLFGESAAQGYRKSQLDLAKMHYEGLGTKKDPDAGLEWARGAAENGYAPAQNWLGQRFFWNNEPRPPDYSLSVRWFRESAQQSNQEGMVMLGDAYRFGRGVPKDIRRAIELYVKAADMGSAEALQRMSYIYDMNLLWEREIPAKELSWEWTVRYP